MLRISAQDRFKITEEKDLVTLAEETIPQSAKDRAMWSFAYTKDGYIGESVGIVLLLIWHDLSVVGDILMVHSKLDDIPVEDLNNVMSQFISEIRKESDERYPAKTLHEFVSSLV